MAAPRSSARAGYSLVEMLIVLAIMAMATAIAVPAAANFRDQLVIHAVQFEFQRGISDLRRRAYRSETALSVRSSTEKAPGPNAMIAPLRAGWSYRLDQPIEISAGGLCSSGRADVLRDGRVAMRLVTSDRSCHFVRL